MIFTIFYTVSIIVAVLTITTGIFAAVYRSQEILLPKASKIYLLVSYFVPVIATAVLSFLNGIVYFCYENQTYSAAKYFKLFTVFTSQTTRNFFFTVVLERLIATVLLEKYILSHKICFVWALLIFSQFITCVFVYMFYTSGFISNDLESYKVFTFCVFGFYLFTLATFILLLILNKYLYKVTAYRITLKKRHQIKENVKVLSYLFLPILIYTFLTPIATGITIIDFYWKLPQIPSCIFHFFYNFPQLLIFIRHIFFIPSKESKPCKCKLHLAKLKNMLNKNHISDIYFKNLKQQWK